MKRLAGPWIRPRRRVPQVMQAVLLALLPGIIVSVAVHGPGVLAAMLYCSVGAVGAEAAILALRQRPLGPPLGDFTAILTGVLLGLCLPPWLPWWQPLLAGALATGVGKQLFGGLGQNPFNPAMVGYVMLLVSLPASLAMWPADASTAWNLPGAYWWGLGDGSAVDGWTGATPLDAMRNGLRAQLTTTEVLQSLTNDQAGLLAAAWAAGGLWLWRCRVIQWRIPLAVLAGTALPALIGQAIDADRFAPLSFHLLQGATVFGAIFIATDPVSASTTPRGRLVFGFGIGLLTWVIRSYGDYPDGFAFAVLLMNMLVPLIDARTVPRVYGQERSS